MPDKSKFMKMFEQLSDEDQEKVAQSMIHITELIIEKGIRRSHPTKEILSTNS